MKYLILSNDNVVMHISSTLEYQENGNPLIYDGTLAINKYIVGNVVTLNDAEVSEDILENPEKYCYTENGGFTLNPNYVEPVKEISNVELMEQITDLQLALAELVEGGLE